MGRGQSEHSRLLEFRSGDPKRGKPSWGVFPTADARAGELIGEIIWEPNWRRYVLAPRERIIEGSQVKFATEHMFEMIDFIRLQMLDS